MYANHIRRIGAAGIILAALSHTALASGAPSLPGSDRMFNPQPEPPPSGMVQTQTRVQPQLQLQQSVQQSR